MNEHLNTQKLTIYILTLIVVYFILYQQFCKIYLTLYQKLIFYLT